MIFMTRIDPTRKLQRFWLARVTPTLLGGWAAKTKPFLLCVIKYNIALRRDRIANLIFRRFQFSRTVCISTNL